MACFSTSPSDWWRVLFSCWKFVCKTAGEEPCLSELPDLVLWMIMERLDFVDNLHFSVVCKRWRSAYNDSPPLKSRFPQIMFEPRKYCSSDVLEFFSTSNNSKYTMKVPDLEDSKVLDSIEGWLLLCRIDVSNRKGTSKFVLLNPFTKKRHELPNASVIFICRGTFQVIDEAPQSVEVIACLSSISAIMFRLSQVNDREWRTQNLHIETTVQVLYDAVPE